MWLAVNVLANSAKKRYLTDREKLPVMFLKNKVLTERYELSFRTLSTNNQGTAYLFSVE